MINRIVYFGLNVKVLIHTSFKNFIQKVIDKVALNKDKRFKRHSQQWFDNEISENHPRKAF